ncbi:pheromone A receptor-domain-containing protein [Lactifluus volemus]|nr:pheromone A receptor-domain-containing protein [Lactifluus volemus]
MSSTVNQVYTVCSFIGIVLSVIPFYWHLQACNTGTCMYMIWTALGCLISFINSILWRGNVLDKAPIYCDIVTRLQAGISIAIPACTLCITRRLYEILVRQAVTITRADKRRAVTIDLIITAGLPVLAMGLQYIVTPHSYEIYEDIGCQCQTLSSFTVPAILLFNAWPLVIGCVSFVYCSMILYHFIKRKRQLAEVMSSHKGLYRTGYIRLMLLACSEMLITVPYPSFLLIYAFKHGLTKFSWSTLRHNFTHVPQYSTVEWQSDTVEYAIIETDAWSLVYCSFIFFAFFGFAEEARDHYRRFYSSITRRIRFSKSSALTFPGSSHAANVMAFAVKSRKRHDSILSFSDQPSIPSESVSHAESDIEIEQQDSPLDSTVPSSDGPLDESPQLSDEVNPTVQLTSTHTTDGADAV